MSLVLTNQVRDFTDVDIMFSKHPITETLAIKKNVNAVRQSIMNLMTLKEYDKPFHPEIKSPIYGYLFENASMVVKVVLEGEIYKYLTVYEPRAKIHKVMVNYPDPNSIGCEIVAEIVNVSEPFTVNILVDRLR
jgi:phage baseplate assembly protein W